MANSLMSPAKTIAIVSTEYRPITVGDTDCYGYTLVSSEGDDSLGFYIATESDGSDGVLFPAGIPGINSKDFAKHGEIIMYCKSVSASINLILFPAKVTHYEG